MTIKKVLKRILITILVILLIFVLLIAIIIGSCYFSIKRNQREYEALRPEREALKEMLSQYVKINDRGYSVKTDKIKEYNTKLAPYAYIVEGIPIEDMYVIKCALPNIGDKCGIFINPDSDIDPPVQKLRCFGIEFTSYKSDLEYDISYIDNIKKAIRQESKAFDKINEQYSNDISVSVYLSEDKAFYWHASILRSVSDEGKSDYILRFKSQSTKGDICYYYLEDDGELFQLLDETFYSLKT